MNEETKFIDCVENFENFYKYTFKKMGGQDLYTKEESAYIWLCDFFATFYDSSLELKWGKLLYKTIKSIIEKKQNDMLDENYEEYLICLNLIGEENLDWGSSIRYCWFDNNGLEKDCINYLKQIEKVKNEAKQNE